MGLKELITAPQHATCTTSCKYRELKQQRFWATDVDRKWTFCITAQWFGWNSPYKRKETWQFKFVRDKANEKGEGLTSGWVDVRRSKTSLLQLSNIWDTVGNFGLNDLPLGLCFWSASAPYQSWSKRSGTTLNGGDAQVSIISHRRVTSSDLKYERPGFRRPVATFLQLTAALKDGKHP